MIGDDHLAKARRNSYRKEIERSTQLSEEEQQLVTEEIDSRGPADGPSEQVVRRGSRMLQSLPETCHPPDMGAGQLKGVFPREPEDDAGELMEALFDRLIPKITATAIHEVKRALTIAQTNPPADKHLFVAHTNQLLDFFKLRIQAVDKQLYRLRVSENGRGVESIKLVGKQRGKSRGFQNTAIRICSIDGSPLPSKELSELTP